MNLNINNIINHNGVLSSNQIELTIPITSNVDNLNAYVDIMYPSDFSFNSHTAQSQNSSTYDDLNKRWNVSVNKDEVAVLKLILDFNEPTDLNKTYSFSWSVTGVDTNLGNNDKTVYLEYKKVFSEPLAGATPDKSACLCVDVSVNDTECSQGTTEWRLDVDSIANGVLQDWDVTTGQGHFTPINPTQSITFTYDLFCIQGGDEYEIACDVSVEIYPQLSNINVFDHTICQVNGSDLSTAEVTILESQYPDLDVSLYTWNLLKNGGDFVTSGTPLPIYKELSGYLCTEDGTTVFVWNDNGTVSFKLTDGTDFLGDVLTLTNCCCNTNDSIEDNCIKHIDEFQNLNSGNIVTVTNTPDVDKHLFVFRNGVYQNPSTEYTQNGLDFEFVIDFGFSNNANDTETVTIIYYTCN